MSFRSRLTLFFVLIVLVPMAAVAVVVFRLIDDNEKGKADARVAAFAVEAQNLYGQAVSNATAKARTVAKDAVLGQALLTQDFGAARARARELESRLGLRRVVITQGGKRVVDLGTGRAIAPGSVKLTTRGGGVTSTIVVSELDAVRYAFVFRGPGVAGAAIRRGGKSLVNTLEGGDSREFPDRGEVKLGGKTYRVASFSHGDFDGNRLRVTVLTDSSAATSSIASSRVLAAALLVGFFLLAFIFAVAVSRALQAQIQRFLVAARRLGGGDFAVQVPTEGRDEFAALGQEFNTMAAQLEQRLEELSQERARLRESIRRMGESLESSLDRDTLLELSLQAAVDAVEADAGRTSLRDRAMQAFTQRAVQGELKSFEAVIRRAEVSVLNDERIASASEGELHALAAPLGPAETGRRVQGVLTVARRGTPFSEEERQLVGGLAGQAFVSIENVELHHQVARQAVTDELTGLFNHRRFQEVMDSEVAAAKRFSQELGLLMLDVDNFKKVNDTYGHQQGDLVLKEVARVVKEESREIDEPARYGGEEMAVALLQTDIEGAFTIAERMRTAIEALSIERLDGDGPPLKVTASFGVAASADWSKDQLIAAADAALYQAKHSGKNRTVRAGASAVVPSD